MSNWGAKLKVELAALARKLSGEKKRVRAAADAAFDAALAALKPGDLAIDLGANMGDFTARMADTGADVIAFEPDPYAFEKLASRLGTRANVTLINAAAAGEAGELTLYRHSDFDSAPERRTTASTLVKGAARSDESGGLQVTVHDFAAFLRETGRDVALLKVDIEGSEVGLFERLLDSPEAARLNAVFVETHERILPQLAARTDTLKARTAQMAQPSFNWDWR